MNIYVILTREQFLMMFKRILYESLKERENVRTFSFCVILLFHFSLVYHIKRDTIELPFEFLFFQYFIIRTLY